MTKFIDFNVFTKGFFCEPLPSIKKVDEGEEVNPAEFPVLEIYIPEDEAMQE